MTKAKLNTAFRSITKTVVDVFSSWFYICGNVSVSLTNSTAICTVFVLCQLLINKLFVMIYIWVLFKLEMVF